MPHATPAMSRPLDVRYKVRVYVGGSPDRDGDGRADGKLLMWALDVSSFFERNKEDALLAHSLFFAIFWVETGFCNPLICKAFLTNIATW